MATINLNTIYTQYYRKALLFTKSYIHDDLMSEDIVSEAIISLWESGKTEEILNTEAFLITTLRNKALNYLRHLQVREEAYNHLSAAGHREIEIRISSLEDCDPQEILSEELREHVIAILNTLPEQTRIVFELSRLEENSYQEIAAKLGITVKGVEYHISKALKVLRENLKDYLPMIFFL